LAVDNAGLVSIYNNNGSAYLQFWRSVFERRAPRSLASIEQSITPIKQRNTIREVSDELLNALTLAYREAADEAIEA
jgi:2,4-dienoyl-CoA reductase-like NADH-dependent reductase (Old Yellow Enzyme family)